MRYRSQPGVRARHLVQAVVAPEHLIATAKEMALAMVDPTAPWDRPDAHFDSAPYDFDSTDVFPKIAKSAGISNYQLRHYPAYRAIMECVAGGWGLPMTTASEHEMDVFVALMQDAVAGNMVRTLFLNRQKAAKLGLLAPNGPLGNDPKGLAASGEVKHAKKP